MTQKVIEEVEGNNCAEYIDSLGSYLTNFEISLN